MAERGEQTYPKPSADETSSSDLSDDGEPPSTAGPADVEGARASPEKQLPDDGNVRQRTSSDQSSQRTHSRQPASQQATTADTHVAQRTTHTGTRLSEGGAALHEACRQGLLDRVMKAMLAMHPAAINERNEYGQTHGQLHIVFTLLTSLGVTGLNAAQRQGDVDAALSEHWCEDVVQCLIEHGADVNAQDIDGETPLYQASMNNQRGVVTALLLRGAAVNVRTKDGTTPLWIAAQNGHTDIVKVLLQYDAGTDIQYKTVSHSATPLYVASQQGHADVVRLLLQHNADTEIPCHGVGSGTPLVIASQKGHTGVVTLLLEHGAETEFTHDDCTPLYLAAQNGHASSVQALLQHGAERDFTRRDDGLTPLLIASHQGHIDTVRILLQHGADVDIKNKRGDTAMGYARREGHSDIVRLLKQADDDILWREFCCTFCAGSVSLVVTYLLRIAFGKLFELILGQ